MDASSGARQLMQPHARMNEIALPTSPTIKLARADKYAIDSQIVKTNITAAGAVDREFLI